MRLRHFGRGLAKVAMALLCLVPSCPGQYQQKDFYSSVSSLTELTKFEVEVKAMLLAYVEHLKMAQNAILQFVNVKQAYDNLDSKEATSRYLMHAINAFHLMKRMTVHLGAVETQIHGLRLYDPLVNITAMRKHRLLPWEEDFGGLAAALVRLQDTYQLNMSRFADGHIDVAGTEQVASGHQGLSGRDRFFVGKVALNGGFFDRAVEWFEEALRQTNAEDPPTVTRSEILPFYEAAVKKHDEVLETKGRAGRHWQTYGVPVSERHERPTDFEAKLFVSNISQVQERQQFKRLCRGERLRSPNMDSQLRCRYFYGKHPFLRLQRVKLEEANLQPYVAALYGVIPDKDIEDLMAYAKPRLQRSTHYGHRGAEASSVRTSSNAWLGDEDADVARRLNSYLSDLLGLGSRMEEMEAERYQLANYGIGGQYLPHIDFLQTTHHLPNRAVNDFEGQAGDRIATLMIYLSDVEEGGATVFPSLGVRLTPKRGDAAFWWNLRADGQGDRLTMHGGCPVLFGSKWIANKWFRANCNMFRLPCTRNPWDAIAPL